MTLTAKRNGHIMFMMNDASELNGPFDLTVICAGDGPLRAAWLYTPIGGMVAVADGHTLHLLEFPRITRLRAAFARLGAVAMGETVVATYLQDQLTDYFAGRIAKFDVPLAPPASSGFTASVWAAVAGVPYGQTATYGQIAQQLGTRSAARAVGRANGANPFAILVPCHRITGTGGLLMGYAGGLWRKEWLLAHEQRGLKPS